MKKFIKKIFFITASFVLIFMILVFLFSKIVESKDFNNWETESNLLIMKPNTHFDILFLGNSHSRMFSRHKNHERVERILHKTIINFGRTGGTTGYSDYLLYLQYAYSKNVTFDTIVVNIFSEMLLSKTPYIASNTFENEPFKLDFFIRFLKYPYTQNKFQKSFYYMRSKLSIEWITHKPFSLDAKTDSLLEIDSTKIKEGFEIAFADGVDTVNFNYTSIIVEEIVKLAKNNGATVVFITTPTLFGNWPHQEMVEDLMVDFNLKYGTKYYNFADSIKNPNYYYDHHHLNTKGIVKFVDEYLKPIVFNE